MYMGVSVQGDEMSVKKIAKNVAKKSISVKMNARPQPCKTAAKKMWATSEDCRK
jgi:hypothetical protein